MNVGPVPLLRSSPGIRRPRGRRRSHQPESLDGGIALTEASMLSNFFLDRPVFAWVIAIMMVVAGGLAIHNLPISQYPPIAPPSIAIDAFYPGASAETVENSVIQIIEQKMEGFDKLLYMSATSDASGAGRHRTHLCARHRSGPGLGPGAEQTAARHGQPARGGPAAGRQGQQVHQELSADCRPDFRRRQHG